MDKMQTLVSNDDCSYEHWMRTICFNANDAKSAEPEAIAGSHSGFNGHNVLVLLLAALVVGMAVVMVKRNRKYERDVAELKQQMKS